MFKLFLILASIICAYCVYSANALVAANNPPGFNPNKDKLLGNCNNYQISNNTPPQRWCPNTQLQTAIRNAAIRNCNTAYGVTETFVTNMMRDLNPTNGFSVFADVSPSYGQWFLSYCYNGCTLAFTVGGFQSVVFQGVTRNCINGNSNMTLHLGKSSTIAEQKN